MKIQLTKEMKVELLKSLKQGYLDTLKLNELIGKPICIEQITGMKIT